MPVECVEMCVCCRVLTVGIYIFCLFVLKYLSSIGGNTSKKYFKKTRLSNVEQVTYPPGEGKCNGKKLDI